MKPFAVFRTPQDLARVLKAAKTAEALNGTEGIDPNIHGGETNTSPTMLVKITDVHTEIVYESSHDGDAMYIEDIRFRYLVKVLETKYNYTNRNYYGDAVTEFDGQVFPAFPIDPDVDAAVITGALGTPERSVTATALPEKEYAAILACYDEYNRAVFALITATAPEPAEATPLQIANSDDEPTGDEPTAYEDVEKFKVHTPYLGYVKPDEGEEGEALFDDTLVFKGIKVEEGDELTGAAPDLARRIMLVEGDNVTIDLAGPSEEDALEGETKTVSVKISAELPPMYPLDITVMVDACIVEVVEGETTTYKLKRTFQDLELYSRTPTLADPYTECIEVCEDCETPPSCAELPDCFEVTITGITSGLPECMLDYAFLVGPKVEEFDGWHWYSEAVDTGPEGCDCTNWLLDVRCIEVEGAVTGFEVLFSYIDGGVSADATITTLTPLLAEGTCTVDEFPGEWMIQCPDATLPVVFDFEITEASCPDDGVPEDTEVYFELIGGQIFQDSAGTIPAGTSDLVGSITNVGTGGGSWSFGDAGRRPLLDADGFLVFDGTDFAETTYTLGGGATGMTWFGVVKFTTAGYHNLFDAYNVANGYSSDSPALWIDTSAKFESNATTGGVPATAYNDGIPHSVIYVSNASGATLYVDGVSVGTGVARTIGGKALDFFHRETITAPFIGAISKFGLLERDITGGEVTALAAGHAAFIAGL